VNDEAALRPADSGSPDHASTDAPSRFGGMEPLGALPPPVPAMPPPWRRPYVVAGTLLALVALALAVVFGRAGGSKAPPAAEAAPLVSVHAPGLSAVTTRVTFTGAIVARYDMPIGVEGEGGRIAAVLVEVGDKVRRGQVLARLDSAVAAPQVASLEATRDQYRAEAKLAEADYRRAAAVAASVGALSREEVDRRQSQVATSAARLKAAEAQLTEAEARLGRMEIRAPADGLVLTRTAEAGQSATPGGPPLFRLGRDGEVEMRGQVSEQDMPRLALGQAAEVRLTSVAEPFAGKVRLLGAVIDPQTRLGEVRVALAPHPDLRPGAFARAEVQVARGMHPVVPQTAVLADAQGNYVLIAGPDNRVVRRAVRFGGAEAGGIVITAGLDGSERVITTAAAFLREGELVRVTDAAPP
jgi:HlyD family secretion protein